MQVLPGRPIQARWLLGAYGWATLCGIVAFAAPISDNGRTLFAWNHALVLVAGSGLVLLLAIGTSGLTRRMRRRSTQPGVVTTVISGCVMLFSLLGFVFGVASLGAIAFLVLMSGMPLKPLEESQANATQA